MIDGIHQNPFCYRLIDLNIGHILYLKKYGEWIIDGDKLLLIKSGGNK